MTQKQTNVHFGARSVTNKYNVWASVFRWFNERCNDSWCSVSDALFDLGQKKKTGERKKENPFHNPSLQWFRIANYFFLIFCWTSIDYCFFLNFPANLMLKLDIRQKQFLFPLRFFFVHSFKITFNDDTHRQKNFTRNINNKMRVRRLWQYNELQHSRSRSTRPLTRMPTTNLSVCVIHEKRKKIEFRKYLIAYEPESRVFFCVSWLSWQGNSILNGQNGPNTKYECQNSLTAKSYKCVSPWSDSNVSLLITSFFFVGKMLLSYSTFQSAAHTLLVIVDFDEINTHDYRM